MLANNDAYVVFTDDLRSLLKEKPWGDLSPSIQEVLDKKLQPFWDEIIQTDSSQPLTVGYNCTKLHILRNAETLARNILFNRKHTLLKVV